MDRNELRGELGRNPAENASCLQTDLDGLSLGELPRLVLHAVLPFEHLCDLSEHHVRLRQIEGSDHSDHPDMILSAPTLTRSADGQGVTRGNHTMNSEKTDGVPSSVGGGPVHLAGELTRSCQVNGIPCLRQNFCSSHRLASPGLHFHSLSLDRFEEGGVPGSR